MHSAHVLPGDYAPGTIVRADNNGFFIACGAGVLEYDGLAVETGPLNDQGLTPVSAIPALLVAWGSKSFFGTIAFSMGFVALMRYLGWY